MFGLKSRADLSAFLHTKAPNVYFQPTENTKLKYPCLLYAPYSYDKDEANNNGYLVHNSYQVTYITTDTTSTVPEELLKEWPMSTFNAFFVNDNLYHSVVIMYTH